MPTQQIKPLLSDRYDNSTIKTTFPGANSVFLAEFYSLCI